MRNWFSHCIIDKSREQSLQTEYENIRESGISAKVVQIENRPFYRDTSEYLFAGVENFTAFIYLLSSGNLVQHVMTKAHPTLIGLAFLLEALPSLLLAWFMQKK
mmetsp:Transcript_35160/g.51695  ORF Transcript_35160/g.51695 Transcript_35160/m.51695 type:complete len:104 (+) Transcript_35160:288-599(+)